MSKKIYDKGQVQSIYWDAPHSWEWQGQVEKVNSICKFFQNKMSILLSPYQNVAVDKQLVKWKHRSGIRQYIATKPVKFGVKLWVLADSKIATLLILTFIFWKTNQTYKYGLGYGVLMKLAQPLINQGYRIFFDNFYMPVKLLNDLFILNTPSCGTVTENRKGFPNSMKNRKIWAKKKTKGKWDGFEKISVWCYSGSITKL